MKIDTGKYEEGKLLPVVEEFYSLQGEGFHMGKPAYFLRIGGCDVGCNWCDSKRSWNPEIHPAIPIDDIISNITSCPARAVVVTGGEPLLFNLDYLCDSVMKGGVMTMIETSGAHEMSGKWDWICLSPKRQMPPGEIYFKKANELKMIISDPSDFAWAEENAARAGQDCELYLQPEWSVYNRIIPRIVDYIMEHPKWKVSLQAHKFMKIP